MAFCTSCGAQLDDGNLFCEHCGARQDAPAGQSTPMQQTVAPAYEQPAAPVQPTATQIGYSGASYGQPAAAPTPRKPLPLGAKIALIAVAAVIVPVALLSFIMGKVG